jgi:hypothetical protein
LEANYFPLNDPEPNFREERIVAAEVRSETLAGKGRSALRRRAYVRRQAAEAAGREGAAAKTLAQKLVAQKHLLSQLHESSSTTAAAAAAVAASGSMASETYAWRRIHGASENYARANEAVLEDALELLSHEVDQAEAQLKEATQERLMHLEEEKALTLLLEGLGIAVGENDADDVGMRHWIEKEWGGRGDNVVGRELLQAGEGRDDHDWTKFLGLKV